MFSLDERTLLGLSKKDEQAFQEFYRVSVKTFFRYIRGKSYLTEAQAEDLVSELYMKIRNNLHTYKAEFSFETRCWSILRNLMVDTFRKTKEYSLQEYEADDIYSQESVSETFDKQRSFDLISEALSKLDETTAEIIHLKYIEELTHEEIQTTLGLSPEVMRQRLSRGLRKIRDMLGE